ncbi:heme NO-binding domain-containing protein [Pelagibius sp.]|uniref:heme NO-binding domain-containing protein n=1 Tax=Pelagibius sp. TaxID=1931238 RepID=UPI0026128FC3|nr:heme NO-binding domain-containing protein [Pelagibius sp.]
MLGYPFRPLLQAIEAAGGMAAVGEVKRRAGVPAGRTYRMSEVYSDTECQRVLAAAVDVLGRSAEEICDLWAAAFLEDTQKRFPTWYAMCADARALLECHPEIHDGFAASLTDPEASRAVAQKFRIEKRERELIVHYRSPNRLCRLYRALAQRVIAHYGDAADVEETQCLHRGDPECEFRIRWIS